MLIMYSNPVVKCLKNKYSDKELEVSNSKLNICKKVLVLLNHQAFDNSV